MNTQTPIYRMWSVGLSARDLERIRACMDAGHSLTPLSEETPPTPEDAARDKPVLVWIGESFHRKLLREKAPCARFLEPIPRVLVLSEDCSPAEIEDALDRGFADVLRGTGNSERIHRILRRSLEKGNARRDRERMMREILMNRELLSRKSDVFSFLLDFVLQTSACATREAALNAARESLSALFPLAAMHVALWSGEEDDALDLCLDVRLDARLDARQAVAPNTADAVSAAAAPCEGGVHAAELARLPDALRAWTTFLIGAVETFFPARKAPALRLFYRGADAPGAHAMGKELRPDTRRILLLPLCSGEDCRGALALLLEREYPLGRDEAVALDAAATHLAALLPGRALRENDRQSGNFSIAG